MVLTLERPTETQTNPHFNPEIPMDQLARSIFLETKGFNDRHSFYLDSGSAVVFKTDGQHPNSPAVTLFYGVETSSGLPQPEQSTLPLFTDAPPKSTKYRWQLSTPTTLVNLSVNNNDQLQGWRASYDNTRRATQVVDLDKQGLLESWRQITHITRSEEFAAHIATLRAKRIEHERVLGQFLASHEVIETVPLFDLSNYGRVVSNYFDRGKKRLMANVSIELQGQMLDERIKQLRDTITKIGFTAMAFHPRPDIQTTA